MKATDGEAAPLPIEKKREGPRGIIGTLRSYSLLIFLSLIWGVAFVANGLSRRHRQYLALGGLGFVLGDGNISYGPEEIMETYYNFPIARGLFGAFDLQYINNPGYNRARGPVVVPGLRLHVEL